MTLLIRERPRLALMLDIATPSSTHARWAPDEDQAANAPSNLTFSSTMPGGMEAMSCSLTRKAGRDYPDLAEFSTITVSGIGGQVAWQGRLETTPRTSGDQLSITPGAVGWQAALDDDQSAQMIYVDRDMTRWGAPSTRRQLALANGSIQLTPAGVASDPSPTPAIQTTFGDAWVSPFQQISEAWYDAGGSLISVVYYDVVSPGPVLATDDEVQLSDDDIRTNFAASGNVYSTTGSTGYLHPAVAARFALIWKLYSATPGGTQGATFLTSWRNLAVYGNHGLTGAGSDPQGLLASDIVQHAVSTWAPELATSRAGVSTIETSTFVIPHLAFYDPTTASEIIKQATRFGLPDWWVDEGPTFNLASRENHGRRWRARVGPSGLQETGPQVDRLFNSVIVSYNDVTGVTRTVGPTGSGANTIDDSLTDTDPANPANVAGITRRSVLAMGITSTPAAASQVGQDWLAEQRLLSTAGQAQIVGHVEDDHGVLWPAWMIRAGDSITFTDAHDPVPRRIVRAGYSDSTRACQLDLDSPPEGLSALLSRLSVSLTPLGLS